VYTKVTDPLPPHSTQPYPQFALNAMTMRRAQIELWVRQARAGTLCAPNPVDYASLGPQIMKNVSRVAQQGTLTGANALAAATPSPTPTDISQPPQVIPMNVPTSAAVPLITTTPTGTGNTTPGSVTWGDSPVTPPAPAAPSIQSLISSVPSWIWILAGLAAVMSMNGGGKTKGLNF
jgi:hypothetical protein